MKKKHCCANEARFLRLLPQQGRTEVKWCPGQAAGLAPPCSNLKSFGSKCTELKKEFVTLLGLYGATRSDLVPPIVIWRQGICAPLPPRYAPA